MHDCNCWVHAEYVRGRNSYVVAVFNENHSATQLILLYSQRKDVKLEQPSTASMNNLSQ
jgi:hypothetical protein